MGDNKNIPCTGVRSMPSGPSYIPCGGEFYQTDCCLVSDGVLDGTLDIGISPSVSDFIRALLGKISNLENKINRQDSEINELRNRIR